MPGPIHGNLALTLRMLGRSQEAVLHAEEAIRSQPENPVTWDTLGSAHYELGNRARTRAAGHVAICLDPRSAEAWHNLANTLLEFDRYAEAERSCRAALSCNSDLVDAWSGIGSSNMRQRRYTAAPIGRTAPSSEEFQCEFKSH